jgi:hypothetical protein
VTHTVFAQVAWLVRAGGLSVFHPNSLKDRPLRARRAARPRTGAGLRGRGVGPDDALHAETCLRELLAGESQLHLAPAPIRLLGACFATPSGDSIRVGANGLSGQPLIIYRIKIQRLRPSNRGRCQCSAQSILWCSIAEPYPFTPEGIAQILACWSVLQYCRPAQGKRQVGHT